MLLVLAKGGVRCMMVGEQEADSCSFFRWPEYGFICQFSSSSTLYFSILPNRSDTPHNIPGVCLQRQCESRSFDNVHCRTSPPMAYEFVALVES